MNIRKRNFQYFEHVVYSGVFCPHGIHRIPDNQRWEIHGLSVQLTPTPDHVPLDVMVELYVGAQRRGTRALCHVVAPEPGLLDRIRRLEDMAGLSLPLWEIDGRSGEALAVQFSAGQNKPWLDAIGLGLNDKSVTLITTVWGRFDYEGGW